MKIVVFIRELSIFLFAGLLVVGCSKKYDFNYQDGTPGDGATAPNITIDTSVKKIDVTKYPQARVFPGLVCAQEPRLNNVTVAMDLNYNFVGDALRISVPPQPMFSTGLYAAAGELVIIDVPAGEYSLGIQVGVWTDNLSNVQNAPRDPLLFSKMQLAPGRNYVRNLYGGHIYINAGRPIASPVNIVFSNVVKSPDFILGVTSNAEWQAALKASCVPWVELRSKNLIFTVPREYCISRPIADPTALMNEWDNAINFDFYQWEGLEVNPANPIDKAPLLPWRVAQDIKPVVGYGHSGFPVVTVNDYGWFDEFTNISQIRGGGCWGTFHEIGHNNQQNTYWSWSTLGETSNNLFVFKVAKRQEALYPSAWPPKHPALPNMMPQALAFASDPSATKNFDGTDTRINDPFARLTPFVQIFDKIPADWSYPGQPAGWNLMGELYKKARRANRISLNDQDKRDFFYETVCDFTRKDWKLFFKAWGITVSNISLNKMAALYPVMDQEISTYNPLTRTGGDGNYYYNRVNWTYTTNSFSSSEGTNGFIANAFDGLTTTYWHSNYGTGTGPTSPNANTGNPAGFWVLANMNKSLPVNGFSFALRQNGTATATRVVNIKVETSDDNINWQLASFATLSPKGAGYVTLANVIGLQNFNLAATKTFRYFRVSIPTNADLASGTSAALSEINIIKP